MNKSYDIRFDNPEPIKEKMSHAMDYLTQLFPGKSVSFFMADFDDIDHVNIEPPRMYYASNSQKDSVMHALKEYIIAHQNHG